jgi:hypothetical protein
MRLGQLLWRARQHLNYAAFSLQQMVRGKVCRPSFVTPRGCKSNTEVADIGARAQPIWTFRRRPRHGAGYAPGNKKPEKHVPHAELQTLRDCYSAANLSMAAKPDEERKPGKYLRCVDG